MAVPPLVAASRAGNVEEVAALLESRADINVLAPLKKTSLMGAITFNHVDIAQLLITHRADLDVTTEDYGTTALSIAAGRNHLQCVTLLIQAKADLNKTDDKVMNTSRNPLQAACKTGNTEVVCELIAAGAEVVCSNACDGPLICGAASHGRLGIVDALLRGKASPGPQIDEDGRATCGPIFGASHRGHLSTVQCLLEARASANEPAGDRTTPLLQTSLFGHVGVVKALLAARADVHVQRTEKHIMDCDATSLYLAAKRGCTEVVQLLLAARASVNAPTVDNETPLYAACCSLQPAVVRLLVEAAADVHSTARYDSSTSALHVAADAGFLEAAELLVEARADVTLKAPDGKTPCDLAKSREMRGLLEGHMPRESRKASGSA